ncbi:MAG TPA: DUF3857 and transglutaminase domain-containing protein [Rhizomicrobium sp.]|nr:DUF3857 and transglutaminase domain-containing protein [Rhizomicrobium sp.]
MPANLPAKITVMDRQIDVAPDGSATLTSHAETKILQQNAIAQLGQLKLSYSDGLQQIDINAAYTLKPDGRKIPVGPDAIIVQQSPATQNAPMLSDMKQKVIIFPDVEVGDTLVTDSTIRSKPAIPGSFFYDVTFPAALPIDEATVSIAAPKTMALTLETRSLDAVKSADGDRVLYKIRYTNQHPLFGAVPQADYDLMPRLSVSTFKDYDALAAAYAPLAAPALTVTPAIQARADEIVAGTSDRREQVRRIYDWVSAHIRYLALEFGQGGIVPHDADHVLANGYGDCKDHATLFVALLKARGIPANLVLINGTNIYTAAKVPTIAPFNHMIVWLPDLRLYADTTNGRVVPFGLLPNAEYGKPVVHIADKSGALHQIPINDAANATINYKLTMVADDAGHISSTSSLLGTGDFSVPLRVLGAALQGQDGAKVASSVLQKSSTPRATGMVTAPLPDADAASYQLSASYSTPGTMSGFAPGSTSLLGFEDHLRALSPFSAAMFGPLVEGRFRDAAAAPCFNGHAVDDESMQYPATRHLLKLPADSKFSGPHISYTSHWTNDGASVSVHREFTAHFDQVLCAGAAKNELLAFADQLKTDVQVRFSLPHLDDNSSTAPPAR